ncbi:MAG TPA: TIGR03086 family metal-binding protein [Actinomycetes bacterium]|nr:TIGR03086 family metal-binding protein [Actinomycetes bacterium]
MSDATQLKRFKSAQEAFTTVINKVESTEWHNSTPCTDWDLRALVNHVAGELFWATPMVDGRSIDDVGDELDGDLMGKDPMATWDKAVQESRSAFNASGAMGGTIQSSMGPMPVRQYISDLTCDLIVHRWDLGDSIKQTQTFSSDELQQLRTMLDQLAPMSEQLVAGGYFAAAVSVPDDSDEQSKVLAAMGRSA